MAADESVYCGSCGYDLTGMGVAGFCPECGNEFDLGTGRGISSQISRGAERGDFLLRRFFTIALLLLTLGIVGIACLAAWGSSSPRPLIWGGLFAGLTALATVTSFVYEKGDD